jgi:hypothetical protein
MLLFTAIMFSTSTYAWFTSNRVVTVNTINVHVAASGGIEISADGTTWKSVILPDDITSVHSTTYPSSVNQIPFQMEPVSTGKEIDTSTGFLKMFYGLTDSNSTGDYVLTSTRLIETEGNGATNEGKFIAFDLFFKVSSDTTMYLTGNSKVEYLNDNGKGIANAIRVAFVNEGNVPSGSDISDIQGLKGATEATTYIWEPNYDTHTASAVANARDVYGITTSQTGGNVISYDGIISNITTQDNVTLGNANSANHPTKFRTVNVNYSTPNNFTNNVEIFTLQSGITKMRIYMWIEGQDVDCENNASYDDVEFNIQLTVNPS